MAKPQKKTQETPVTPEAPAVEEKTKKEDAPAAPALKPGQRLTQNGNIIENANG